MAVGSYMPLTLKQFAACAGLVAAILGSAACAPKRIPPTTVQDLMEDRVTLDGVLLKCNEHPEKVRNEIDCLNARVAIERLAKDVDPAEEARRAAEFERSREKRRLAQEKVRHDQEVKTKVDAYNLPLVPVESVTSNGGTPGTAPVQP
jgi:outer membrane murein-binding lipoprotein Lpp